MSPSLIFFLSQPILGQGRLTQEGDLFPVRYNGFLECDLEGLNQLFIGRFLAVDTRYFFDPANPNVVDLLDESGVGRFVLLFPLGQPEPPQGRRRGARQPARSTGLAWRPPIFVAC